MHVWPKVPRGAIASCLFTLCEAIHACWFGEVRFDPCSPHQRRTGSGEDNLELGGWGRKSQQNGLDVELAQVEPLQQGELITRRGSRTLAGTLSRGAVEEQADTENHQGPEATNSLRAKQQIKTGLGWPKRKWRRPWARFHVPGESRASFSPKPTQ